MTSLTKQLPWRKPDVDNKLYLPMFRLAYLKKMHLIGHGNQTKEWNNFIAPLFEQDGWNQYEKTSGENIKVHYNERIEIFKNKVAWEDGATNKSGLEGELNELETIIRDILLEMIDERERKMLESDEYKRQLVNAVEATVLIPNVASVTHENSANSIKKRKAADEQYVATPLSSVSRIDKDVDDLLGMARGIGHQIAQQNNNNNWKEFEYCTKILEAVDSIIATKNSTIYRDADDPWNIMKELHHRKMYYDDALFVSNYFDVLVNIYCTPNKRFDAEYIKKEWKELGFSNAFTSHILFKMFEEIRASIGTLN